MRYTLEQLQKMDDDMLNAVWRDWQFPFDPAIGCHHCITWHHDMANRKCEYSHNRLGCEVTKLGPIPKRRWWRDLDIPAKWLRAHLEELYALRLFYADCYPAEKHEEHDGPPPDVESHARHGSSISASE